MNRRYIALFVAYKDRTWASALFVSLSAVGMALGPLLSLPLSLFPTRHFAGLTFDHVRPWPLSMNPSKASEPVLRRTDCLLLDALIILLEAPRGEL